MRIDAIHVIFCDDHRLEMNGKRLLIGVYDDGMIIRQSPSRFPLFTAFVTMTTSRSAIGDELTLSLEASWLDKPIERIEAVETEARSSPDQSEISRFVLRYRDAEFREGEFRITVKAGDEPARVVARLPIVVERPQTVVAASNEPPSSA